MLDLKHVSKTYKNGVNALYDVNLKIDQGEFVYIIGPTGSGKSTLIKLLDGEEIPTKGKVEVTGINVGKLKHSKVPLYRRNIGVVFQDFRLLERKTVFENIAFALEVINVPKERIRKRVREVMNLVGLDDKGNSFPQELSGGQQQRVAFARAIVIEPACILFDEPLSALDALLREEMRSELRTLITKLGITGVFVTHDQIEAMSMSDAIAVCHAGKIEQYDTPEKIYSHPATEFVARFVGSSNWLDQNHLFRPEQAQTVPTEQAEKYDADVTAVQFLGSSYQLQLNHNGQDWTYISPRRVSVGEKISLYLPRSAIVAV